MIRGEVILDSVNWDVVDGVAADGSELRVLRFFHVEQASGMPLIISVPLNVDLGVPAKIAAALEGRKTVLVPAGAMPT